MTDRECAVRNALVAELERNGLPWSGLSSLERKHLKEDFNPAFVEWKFSQMTKYSDTFIVAMALAIWAAFALVMAWFAPSAAAWWSVMQPGTFGMALGFFPFYWHARSKRTIYRALHALTVEKAPARD